MELRQLGSIDQALQVVAHLRTRVCFSQFGEDMVVAAMLLTLGRDRVPGFYVDVGAFDPVYASNTHMFHLRGWSGVNIDANPAAIERFRQMRPGDRNVHAAVSDRDAEVEFDIYTMPGLSTADPGTKAAYALDGRGQLAERLILRTRRLRDILDETVPAGRAIDLMSVDVEGMDLAVLRSNDWDRYAPYFLLVEDAALSLLHPPASEVFAFLTPLGYRLASQTYITSIYVRDQPVKADR
jgi:FkbM family methyltransferase